jgi:hypothetical protein
MTRQEKNFDLGSLDKSFDPRTRTSEWLTSSNLHLKSEKNIYFSFIKNYSLTHEKNYYSINKNFFIIFFSTLNKARMLRNAKQAFDIAYTQYRREIVANLTSPSAFYKAKVLEAAKKAFNSVINQHNHDLGRNFVAAGNEITNILQHLSRPSATRQLSKKPPSKDRSFDPIKFRQQIQHDRLRKSKVFAKAEDQCFRKMIAAKQFQRRDKMRVHRTHAILAGLFA